MARPQRPERRPINEGRDPLDRYCRACGALPGVPCTVKGDQSPEWVRTHEDEWRWRRERIHQARIILRRLDGRQSVPIADVVHHLQQANRVLIHESR